MSRPANAERANRHIIIFNADHLAGRESDRETAQTAEGYIEVSRRTERDSFQRQKLVAEEREQRDMSSIAVIHRDSGTPRTYRNTHSQLGHTLIELLTVVIVIGILAAIAVPVYMGSRKAAWNAATLSDVKNASSVIETYSSELDGKLPPSFERKASPNGRVYTLKTFDEEAGTNTTSDIQLTMSPNISLCYTPGTAFVDKDGNTIPYTPDTQTGDYGVYNGQNYRIYATNSNNLDVYYVYDSSTGQLTKEQNPDHIPASSQDTEGSTSKTTTKTNGSNGWWRYGTFGTMMLPHPTLWGGPFGWDGDWDWWPWNTGNQNHGKNKGENPGRGGSGGGTTTEKKTGITYCDLELYYHLYGN